MQCLICGKDSAGEVCNQCIRAEQGVYAKDWTYKEGLIVKKTEDFRVNVTNARVNGIAVISTASNGMNAKIDNFNHYIGCVVGVEQGSYNNKPAPMIHIKTPAGMERYLIFPQMPDEGGLKAGVEKAKAEKMAGGAGTAAAPAPAAAAADPNAAEKLSKLNLLKANGILTEEEYQRERAKLGI